MSAKAGCAIKGGLLPVSIGGIVVLAAFLLVLALPRSAHAAIDWWTDYADTSWYDGASAGTYYISTPEQLAGLSLLVSEREGTQFAGSTIILANDIDISEHQWFPIGVGTDSARHPSFGGTFDGAGHAISGLKCTYDGMYCGLFGRTRGGLIENLTVSGKITADVYAAGITALSEGTSYLKVTNYVNIVTDNAYNAGTGGIVGRMSDSSSDDGYNGGYDVYLEECFNYGDITTQSAYNGVGGIAGDAFETSGAVYFIKCENYGEITAGPYHSGDDSDGVRASGAGGIFGTSASYGSYHIQECTNEGTISCSDYYGDAGGLAGRMAGDADSSILYSYNNGSVIGGGRSTGGVLGSATGPNTVACTYNAGSVSGNGASGIVSLISGSLSLKNNYYLEGTASRGLGSLEDAEAQAEQKTVEQMQMQSMLDLLNNDGESDYFSIEEGKNSGLPILGGTLNPGRGGKEDPEAEADDPDEEAADSDSDQQQDSEQEQVPEPEPDPEDDGNTGNEGDGQSQGDDGEDDGSGAGVEPADGSEGDAGPDVRQSGEEGDGSDTGASEGATQTDSDATQDADTQTIPQTADAAPRVQAVKLVDKMVPVEEQEPETNDASIVGGVALLVIMIWGVSWRYADFRMQRTRAHGGSGRQRKDR